MCMEFLPSLEMVHQVEEVLSLRMWLACDLSSRLGSVAIYVRAEDMVVLDRVDMMV